jgi:hypothetical protein
VDTKWVGAPAVRSHQLLSAFVAPYSTDAWTYLRETGFVVSRAAVSTANTARGAAAAAAAKSADADRPGDRHARRPPPEAKDDVRANVFSFSDGQACVPHTQTARVSFIRNLASDAMKLEAAKRAAAQAMLKGSLTLDQTVGCSEISKMLTGLPNTGCWSDRPLPGDICNPGFDIEIITPTGFLSEAQIDGLVAVIQQSSLLSCYNGEHIGCALSMSPMTIVQQKTTDKKTGVAHTMEMYKTAMHLVAPFVPANHMRNEIAWRLAVHGVREMHHGNNFPYDSTKGVEEMIDPTALCNGLRFNFEHKAVVCPNYNERDPASCALCPACDGKKKLDAGRPYRLVKWYGSDGRPSDTVTFPDGRALPLATIRDNPELELCFTSLVPLEVMGSHYRLRNDWKVPPHAATAAADTPLKYSYFDEAGHLHSLLPGDEPDKRGRPDEDAADEEASRPAQKRARTGEASTTPAAGASKKPAKRRDPHARWTEMSTGDKRFVLLRRVMQDNIPLALNGMQRVTITKVRVSPDGASMIVNKGGKYCVHKAARHNSNSPTLFVSARVLEVYQHCYSPHVYGPAACNVMHKPAWRARNPPLMIMGYTQHQELFASYFAEETKKQMVKAAASGRSGKADTAAAAMRRPTGAAAGPRPPPPEMNDSARLILTGSMVSITGATSRGSSGPATPGRTSKDAALMASIPPSTVASPGVVTAAALIRPGTFPLHLAVAATAGSPSPRSAKTPIAASPASIGRSASAPLASPTTYDGKPHRSASVGPVATRHVSAAEIGKSPIFRKRR